MHELWIGLAALAAGGALAGLAMSAHDKTMRREVQAVADQRALELNNLARDRDYYREQAARLRAQQEAEEAYNAGYVEGIAQGANLNDVERMAYALERKHPDRIVRMEAYRHTRGEARNA